MLQDIILLFICLILLILILKIEARLVRHFKILKLLDKQVELNSRTLYDLLVALGADVDGTGTEETDKE